jgi:1-acyl-sn-glycerol-3-phosphate acyltransferase
MRRFMVRLWGRGFAAIVGMKVSVQGTRPTPPYFIVLNHLSYMDVFVMAHQLGCAYVGRGDIRRWPLLGFLSHSLQVLFINRRKIRDTSRVNRQIEHALKQGDGMAVFAESRISCGRDVEPFKSALIQPAIDNKIPVHYATLRYTTEEGMPSARDLIVWWRPESMFHHLFRLLRHRGFTVQIHYGDEPIILEDRKELAEELHASVRANFVPVE